MESVYHIVAIRVNETSWAHVWRHRFRYLRTGYDIHDEEENSCLGDVVPSNDQSLEMCVLQP
jgi:hypothetical protein